MAPFPCFISVSHTPIVPFHRFPTSQSVGISSNYLSEHNQSICLSVCPCWLSVPQQNGLPDSSRPLPPMLNDDWVTFHTVACLLMWLKVFQLVESWGRSDEGLNGWWRDAKQNRWAEIERCQKRLIIRNSFPKQTYCNHCRIVLCVCTCTVLVTMVWIN